MTTEETIEGLDTLIEIFDDFNEWLGEREEILKKHKELLEREEKRNYYDPK